MKNDQSQINKVKKSHEKIHWFLVDWKIILCLQAYCYLWVVENPADKKQMDVKSKLSVNSTMNVLKQAPYQFEKRHLFHVLFPLRILFLFLI